MALSTPLRWLGILLIALASLSCGIIDKLTDSGDGKITIQRFAASPVTIVPGSPTTLSWEVEGADTVTIDNGIGAVPAMGSRQVQPGTTTTYSMKAEARTSQATATVQVVVQGASVPTPTASPTAAPTPTPSGGQEPAPTPTPTPSATPSSGQSTPTPTPTPTPESSPTPTACGTRAGNAGSCAVAITTPNPAPDGCVQVNLVTVDQSCPVAQTLPVVLRFDVTAQTSRTTLTWRRAPGNGDVMEPGQGLLNGNGHTTVVMTDVVLDEAAEIEILDGGTLLLTLSVHH